MAADPRNRPESHESWTTWRREEPLSTRLTSRFVDRSPVFYGWIVLAAGTLCLMATLPGQTIGVSVFLDHIIQDLGISRSAVSTLYMIGTLVGSLFLPMVGRFIDERGPRLTVFIVSIAFAFACIWMGFVQGVVMLLIGFTLLRALGQGALSLVGLHVVNIWFVRRRGLAIGIAGVGLAGATALFPLAAEEIIRVAGWRNTYMLLAVVIALTIVPVGALFFRAHPERFGQVPDQKHAPRGRSSTPVRSGLPEQEPNFTPAAARRTLTFWVFMVGVFLGSCLGTGLMFHHFSILHESGIDRVAAAAAFVPFGFVSAFANLATGYLMDRVQPKYLLSAMNVFLGMSLIMVPFIAGPSMVVVYGVLTGLRGGMQRAIGGSVMAYYFGRAHIGAIKGFATMALIVGSAFGPLLFSVGLDLSDSYAPVLVASGVFTLTFAALVPFVRLIRDGHVV